MDLQLAADLMRRHMNANGLSSWKFAYMDDDKVFGRCIYRSKTLQLSYKLVSINSEDRVLDTILHEIAHALTPFFSHNEVWKAMARKLGAKPVACYSLQDTNSAMPWVGTCQVGHKYYAKSAPRHKVQSCNHCHPGSFSALHLITWKFQPVCSAQDSLKAALASARALLDVK